jgi:TRAP-type C4-dicarboxylate transport system substrate-binding protein
LTGLKASGFVIGRKNTKGENAMKTVTISLVVIMLSVFFAVSVSPVSAQQPIKLHFATFFGATHKISKLNEEFIKDLEKRTNGAVKVTYHPGSTMVGPLQMYDSVVKGITDIGQSVLGYTPGRFPLSEIFDLPLGLKSAARATKVQNLYMEKFRPKEFDDTKILWLFGNSSQIFHTKKPIRTLEDLKGMKIRAAGQLARFVSLMGGVPVSVSAGEAYEAIERGAADGICIPYEALEGFRLAEVIRYSTENWGTAGGAILFTNINKKTFAAFSPDIKKVITDLSKEYAPKYGQLWDEIDLAGKNYSLSKGNKVISLSAAEEKKWVERARPIIDDYVKRVKAKGLPADEVVKFIEDFKAQK